MWKDNFLSMINTDRTSPTDVLLRDIFLMAFLSPDLNTVLNRFMVKNITHCKESLALPQHEHIVVEIIDTACPGSKSILMFLKHTATADWPPSLYFIDHLDSETVLDSIVQMLKEIPKGLQTALRSDDTYQVDEAVPSPLASSSVLAYRIPQEFPAWGH